MARSEQQIEESIKASFTEINPSLDLKVGVTYDYTIRPIPRELAFVESQVERLLRFYSSDFPNVATPVEARDLATNFGVSVSGGERASGSIVFYRDSPPTSGSTIIIPVGALISTVDGQFLFKTVESKIMFGDFPDTYFNPQTNKFELQVVIQAIAPGSLYNLPPQRITKIVAGQGFDFNGVIQKAPMSGGTEPETSTALATRVLEQFKGINLNSVTGVATLARRFVPTGIDDIKVLRPTDRLEFRRTTTGPALDLCIKGFDITTFQEEYFAVGGETEVKIASNKTVTSVSQVSYNSAVLDSAFWTFVVDSSPEFRGSTRAKSKIEFIFPLVANDVIDILGSKNFLLDKIQAVVTASEDAIFQTDILARSFVDLAIVVGLELKIKNSPNISVAAIESSISAIVSSYIEPTLIPGILTSDNLKAHLQANVPELDSVKIFEFRRRYKSINVVETIIPLKNELPKFESTVSQLTVRS